MKKKSLWTLLVLTAAAGCASLSSDPQTQYETVAAQAKNVSTADVIKIALGCRYYQTKINVPGVKTDQPVKFASVLAMEFSKAKQLDKNASLTCKRSQNNISYSVSVSGQQDRGFSFEYANAELTLNGIVKNGKTTKCLIPLQCTAAFLSEIALK